ncbi:CPBP family intramembrane glutamic endopeptidase [Gillisia sp. Hel_I_29]|uniref:CPBP family intramembrane glutamic endopeptidase n=1 Tax=Gillisia sp. Hel_I_29 TaxID=1249975 RepID=UPI001E6328E2|nr:type II CAAX endopeptidase family protein [Gillisia sp. Hel_I_29]
MSEKSELSGWQRVLIIILPYLFIVGIFQLIGAFAIGLDYEDTNNQKTSEQQLIIQFFSFIGTVFVVWLFMKYVDKEKFVAIGLRLKNNFRSIYLGFFIGLAIMLIGFGLLFNLDEIQYQGLDFDLKELMISILLFLLVSLTEEIIFRGYFLRNLMHSYSKYLALLITATFFALIHTFNPNVGILGLVSIFVAGIFLGITYIHTKNLWFPIALHFS